MRKVLLLTLFIVLNSYSNTPGFFSADFNNPKGPILDLRTKFSSQFIDLNLTTSAALEAYNTNGDRISIPKDAQMTLQTTLDQIYEGFRSVYSDSHYTRNERGEGLVAMDPRTLQIQSVLSELVDLKMQEARHNQLYGDSKSKVKDDLVEVRIKKEGELDKTVKVNLKKAIKENSIKVEEGEVLTARIPTDYDGSDNWTVTPQTEAADIFSCTFCRPKRDDPSANDTGAKLKAAALVELIKTKSKSYSTDKKVTAMVDFAKRNIRDKKEYKESGKGWCYRWVKKALQKENVVDKYLGGDLARYAGTHLKEENFTNLMDDPELAGKITHPNQAPKGAVLVYEPVPADRLVSRWDKEKERWIIVPDAGHVEIKTKDVGEDGYVSDYESDKARTGKALQSVDRKLIGIYIKKPDAT